LPCGCGLLSEFGHKFVDFVEFYGPFDLVKDCLDCRYALRPEPVRKLGGEVVWR
jgi:hypothetical protein